METLEQVTQRIQELKKRTFTLEEHSQFNSALGVLAGLEKTRERLKIKATGQILGYEHISSDKDTPVKDRWGRFEPAVTYRISGIEEAMSPFLIGGLDSCDDVHEWLVQVGAVDPKVETDHEYSALHYYFKTEASAKKFLDRLNKTLLKLNPPL